MNIGDKVKHYVGKGAMFAYTNTQGFLVGTVKAVYASNSYVLKTRGSEVVLTDAKKAILIDDDEFQRTYHPSATLPTQSATSHTIPRPNKQIEPSTTKRSPPSRTTEGPTKAELALDIYKRLMENNNNQHPPRALVISTFVEELGMTEAGASTYAYNTKKKLS